MYEIFVLKALGDNYIYLSAYEDDQAYVVDPGDASIILNALEENNLSLTHILLTHSHFDHTAGSEPLQKMTGCEVIHNVPEGETIRLGQITVRILGTPGHTHDGVSYLVEDGAGGGAVFTGDTLFRGGCGRILGASGREMWQSLQKLATLPEDTQVYCGHNYTVENYEFALSILPEDTDFQQELDNARQQDRSGEPTVPSSIGREKKSNIFLRAGDHEIAHALNMSEAEAEKVFSELRGRKDRW